MEIPPDAFERLDIVFKIFSFLFGAVVGSFLNVVIYRLPRKLSIVSPPSHCASCNAKIKFYDNIPILSYFILRGKCRSCGANFSPRYMLVELLTAVLALTLYYRYALSIQTFAFFVFLCFVIAIIFTDLETWLIPQSLSLPGIVAGVTFNFALGWKEGLFALAGAAGALVLFLGVGYLWYLIRKVEALGGGDVWFFAMLCAWLKLEALPMILVLSTIQGLVIGAPLARFGVFQKIIPLETEKDGFAPARNHIPFGPFLGLAGIEILFFGDEIINWYIAFSLAGN
ncbi:MAG: A24 family peptidase [Myxococcota bacterium]